MWAVFSDGTEGQFVNMTDTAIVWSTRTTSIPDDDLVQFCYKVQKGDCLSDISTAFGIPLEQLLVLNSNIQNPNRIYTGDTIVLMIPE